MALTEIDLSKNTKDATLTPDKISTNPADNFSFPNNVSVANFLGINHPSPTFNLDITGTARISSLLRLPLIVDTTGVNAIDVTNRTLKDGANLISVDWLSRFLVANDGTTTNINFNAPNLVQVNAVLDLTGNLISNIAAPVSANDAANKVYVDTVAQGLLTKAACAAATTTVLVPVTPAGSGVGKTLTEIANGLLTVDGVSVWIDVVNNGGSTNPAASNPASRVLVKDQANPIDNGIYCVTNKGSAGTPFVLTRAVDFDGSPVSEVVPGDFTFIGQGTVNASSGWTVSGSNNPIIVDTDPIPFVQFSGAGQIVAGNGLVKTGNQLDVTPSDASLAVSIGAISVLRDPAGAIGLTGAGVKVNVDGTTISISANNLTLTNPTAHTVAGANTQVQFNNSGAFGASANLTWNGSTLATTALNTNTINQAGGTFVIDNTNRYLLGTTGNFSVAWGAQLLANNAGQWSVVWGDQNIGGTTIRRLADTAGTSALDWTNRLLGDNTGTGGNYVIGSGALNAKTSIDWSNRLLVGTDGATSLLNWASTNTVAIPGSNRLAIGTLTSADTVTVFGTNTSIVKLTGAPGTGVNLTAPGITLMSGDLSGGGSFSTTGGDINLTSGNSTGTTQRGGNITLTSGTGFQARGGNITMTAGNAAGGGDTQGGTLTLTTGSAVGPTGDSLGGSIVLTTGAITGAGSGRNTRGGSITLSSGNYSTGGGAIGGGITLTSGNSGGGGGFAQGGSILLTAGSGGSAGDNGGNVTLTSNTVANGGNLTLTGTAASRGQLTVGGSTPAVSASVDIQSTTRGFLPPRMTTVQKNAIATPATGLIVFDTTLGFLQEYNGTIWTSVSPVTNPGGVSGNVQYNNAGVFAGTTGINTDGTNLTFSGSGSSGSLTFTTAALSGGTSGGITITTGTSTGAVVGGGITLTNGLSDGASTGGSLTLTTANGSNGGATGGSITLTTGTNGVNTQGGSLTLTSGLASGTNTGGNILLTSFTPANGGNITLTGTTAGRGQLTIGGATPSASASLDVQSTTRGFLPPRMTTVQKNAIATPATGLVIYDTTLNLLQLYNGTSWTSVGAVINFVTREVPTGTINGINTVFTLANTPVVGSESVYLNGLLQNVGVGNDYTISGATITFINPPLTGSVLLVSYRF